MNVGDTLIGTSASQASGGRRARAEPKLCTEPGCDLYMVAKGLCSSHYNQKRWAESRMPSGITPERLSMESPDDVQVALARSCLEAGWPLELTVWTVPRLVEVWPRYGAVEIGMRAEAGRVSGAVSGRARTVA